MQYLYEALTFAAEELDGGLSVFYDHDYGELTIEFESGTRIQLTENNVED